MVLDIKTSPTWWGSASDPPETTVVRFDGRVLELRSRSLWCAPSLSTVDRLPAHCMDRHTVLVKHLLTGDRLG